MSDNKQAPPPSNAKELPLRSVFPTKEEFEESYRGPDRHGRGNYPVRPPRPSDSRVFQRLEYEALFTAIMADLGDPKPMHGVVTFNVTYKDCKHIEVAEKAYSKEIVEQVLRKHLGLQSLNPSNPQS